MSFLNTGSRVLLTIVLLVALWGIWEKLKARKEDKRILKQVHSMWLERSVAFTEWLSKNPFENFEHPQYQWHLRKVSSAFSEFIRLQKKEVSPHQKKYLAGLECLVRYNSPIEEPPKE